jgi:hypothetical protein
MSSSENETYDVCKENRQRVSRWTLWRHRNKRLRHSQGKLYLQMASYLFVRKLQETICKNNNYIIPLFN